MGLADQIREALISSSFSAVELSKKTDIHPVNIRQFKSGTRDLPLDKLEKLAEAIGFRATLAKKSKK